MLRLRWALPFLAALLFSAASFAATPEEEARNAMERGVAAAKAGDHVVALALYQRAQELVPQANLPYRFAAESYEALARWEEAVQSYEAYLRVKADVRDADKVRAHIDELRTRYLEGTLDVECEPEGSDVFVDDEASARGATPLKKLTLPKGDHTLIVKRDGFRPFKSAPKVAAGATVIVHCRLERDQPLVTPPTAGTSPSSAGLLSPAQPEAPRASKPFYATWWFWTGAALVVGGVTATVLLTRPSSHGPPQTSGGSYTFP
jgi:tetratricopeptide (TPR) repeat protein